MKTTLMPLLALSIAACAGPPTPDSGWTPTSQATRARGDLIPQRLTTVTALPVTEETTISGSDPASPKEPFVVDRIPEASTQRDFYRLVSQAEAAAGVSLPIDAPRDARVIVTVRNTGVSVRSVHLRQVTTGALLDHARDAVSGPGALMMHMPLATPSVRGEAVAEPSPDAVAAQAAQIGGTEPGFDALGLPRRILSFDEPTATGRVMLEFPGGVGEGGILVEVQQPSSTITLSGAAREYQHSEGDTAEVVMSLANDGAPIDGATFDATLELPNGQFRPAPAFKPIGNGQYLVQIPMQGSDPSLRGVWHLRAKATGATGGVEFERDLETGFTYSPAHARMLAASAPKVVRGKDGLVDEISVDVRVESVIADRLGLRATLVSTDSNGVEHAIAEAQTGQTLSAGPSIMTLHFAAKDLALAKLDGPFHLRDLALVSFSYASTQHRLGRGLELTTPLVEAREIRYPKELSSATQELMDLGGL